MLTRSMCRIGTTMVVDRFLGTNASKGTIVGISILVSSKGSIESKRIYLSSVMGCNFFPDNSNPLDKFKFVKFPTISPLLYGSTAIKGNLNNDGIGNAICLCCLVWIMPGRPLLFTSPVCASVCTIHIKPLFVLGKYQSTLLFSSYKSTNPFFGHFHARDRTATPLSGINDASCPNHTTTTSIPMSHFLCWDATNPPLHSLKPCGHVHAKTSLTLQSQSNPNVLCIFDNPLPPIYLNTTVKLP